MLCCCFPPAYTYKIYSLKLYHLLNFTLHSKADAYSIGTCFIFYMQMSRYICTWFRFYTQMRVEKPPKAFAYRIYSHFTQQCIHV